MRDFPILRREKKKKKMFTDDVVLFGESFEDIKSKIEIVCKWSLRNKMRINADKCEILVWNCTGNGAVRDPLSVSTSFGNILEVLTYKYLGISIQQRMMEEEIVKEAGRKGRRSRDHEEKIFRQVYQSIF
ncbi:hypothetical protein NGRA_3367 [Nosema granulosis]|uniref:Reverse transcriptase domain-containing protein n=1 Tax=Nosema granulosis TaxID=83296 RepID=A0A9P6GVD4_9MICR|nr:hypothetical protein NGRA_3367 [Nosema granulosis]